MIVTTGQRVTMSFGSAALSLSAMISCSKLRVSISAPKFAASDLRGFEIDRGVDRHHQPAIEQRLEGVLDAHFEAIGQILHRHAFREGDGARDRRRRGLRGRLLRTLQRFALLRRLQARRAMLLLRTESRPHRRLAGTLRHARRRTHRLRRQRPRPAKHRRGVALRRTRRSVRTLSLRTRQIAGGGLRRTRRSGRHDARRLRHELPLRLQRRRARRRLAGLLDAQADARRHEAAGLLARDFGAGSALGAAATGSTGAGSAGGASATGAGAASTGGVFHDRRRRGASTGGATASSGFGSAGFAFLISRGGPSVGAAGFGGSGAGAAAPFLPGAAFAFDAVLACFTACSENMSPFGRVMPFCLARRSTNWRATISSSVLDALLSSMPWFFFNSASTSLLGMSRSSATL